jgi:hypothetical protein
MNYKTVITAMIISQATLMASGQDYSEKRIYSKAYKGTREMTLEVRNKYGTIHIIPSGSDSIKIKATVEATASNREKADKMLSGVSVSITESSYSVYARTEFTESITEFLEDFKGITNKLIQYDSRIQVNYDITAPEYLNLRIENKYGDVYMENSSGNVSATISNGSFKAGSLLRAHDLNLSFCDARINKADDAVIDASFSELILGEALNLRISSISSKYEIKMAGKLSADSKRDKFYLGTVASVRGESYFTEFRIDKLLEDADISTKYGSFNAELVRKGFSSLNIKSGYSDIYLAFEPSSSYDLELHHTNTSLTLPENDAKLEKKPVSNENREFITFGTVGRAKSGSSVNIEAVRGKVYIK